MLSILGKARVPLHAVSLQLTLSGPNAEERVFHLEMLAGLVTVAGTIS
jgi:hypothetical protein